MPMIQISAYYAASERLQRGVAFNGFTHIWTIYLNID